MTFLELGPNETEQGFVWVTADRHSSSRHLRLKDFATDHLINAARLCQRRVWELSRSTIHMCELGPYFSGDCMHCERNHGRNEYLLRYETGLQYLSQEVARRALGARGRKGRKRL